MSSHRLFVYNYPLPIPEEEYRYTHDHFGDQKYTYGTRGQVPAREAPRTVTTIAPRELIRRTDHHHHHSSADSTGMRHDNQRSSNYNGLSNSNYSTSSRRPPPTRSGYYVDTTSTYHSSPPEISDDHSPSSNLNESPYRIEMTNTKSQQRYYCDYTDCIDSATGRQRSLGRKADHKRHMQTVHGPPTIDCPRPNCWRKNGNGFRRKDHRDEHLRGYHNRDVPPKRIRNSD